jgi:DNA-binding transcriptional LysR family regulator
MPKSRIRRYIRHGMLPQLAVFEAVSRLGSYTRAAEELFIAQPTVSTQMKKLADTLGVPLVEQSGKRLEITEAGRELGSACADIFARLERLEERLLTLRNTEQGRLRVAGSSAAKHFLPRLLGRFCERYPSVEVSLHIDNWRGMRSRIRQGEDDLYVISNPPQEPELVAYAILPHPIGLYAPVGHRLAGVPRIDPAMLAGESFILREPGSATRRVAEELCAQWGIAPRVRMELASNEAIEQAVKDGLGIAFLSCHVVGPERAENKLRELQVEGLPIMQQWFIAHAKTRTLSRIATTFLDYVRANAAAEAFDESAAPQDDTAMRPAIAVADAALPRER